MASKEDKQETAQALFCAMADYLGQDKIKLTNSLFDVKKYTDYPKFKKEWDNQYSKKKNSVEEIFKNHVKSGQASFQQVDDFLTKYKPWYISSSNIAKQLIAEVNGLNKLHAKIADFDWSEVFYEHKDEIMNNISKLFEVANAKQKKNTDTKTKRIFIPFGELNKWSPADIYFATPLAATEIENAASQINLPKTTFISLNKMISRLIDNGELLPLSLKFAPDKVTIKKVNFKRTQEWKELEKYGGGDVSWTAYPRGKIPQKPPARDLKLFLKNTNNENDKILIRHDASTAGIKGEILLKGMAARGGSLGLEQILGIISLIDDSVATEIKNTFKTLNATFKNMKKPIRKELTDKVKSKGFDMKNKDEKTKEVIKESKKEINYDERVGQLSAIHVSNKIWPIIIKNIFTDENTKSSFVRMTYAYAASMSKDSAKFVVAK
jgi:hypothetical protein